MSDLSRKYGYFRCTSCNQTWESSYVFVYKRTGQAAYSQECKKCLIMIKPYRVENLICSQCGQQVCVCLSKRHSDKNKPHRSDLCEKCQSGHPCQ